MSRSGAEVRQRAALALHAVRFGGESLKSALTVALDGLADSRDRALCEAIAFEGCRWLQRYELLLSQLLQRPLPAKQSRIHALLLAGLAQLDALGLAPHAAISASAEAARSLRLPGMVGLVNAVLRRFDRERAALAAKFGERDDYRYSHPDWLLQRLREAWPQHWPQIVAGNNQPGPLWLRVNRRHGDRSAYLDSLRAAGLDAEIDAALPMALCLKQRLPPTRLPGWSQGQVSVQDGAAQAVAELLDLQRGQRLLDACAAPGGKAAALLEREPGLQLWALDIDPGRVARMRQGLQRLQLNMQVHCADAARPSDWWDGQPFHHIVLDAPCSATGVIRRQPDIKWHRRGDDIAALGVQQTQLLNALWPLLEPGGRLLYTTCSVLPEENVGQIRAFLTTHADALECALPDWLGHAREHGRQRLPGEGGMDGFYYALLEKRR